MKSFFVMRAFALAVLVSVFTSGTSAAAQMASPPVAKTPIDPAKSAAVDAASTIIPAGAPAPEPKPDANRPADIKSFLWEVKSKTGVAYLFGTIHVGKRAFYPLPPQVEAALKQSQRLVVEADISNTDGLANIDEIINYQAPDSLDKHIPTPLFERLKTQLARLQIPVEAVKLMKPFLIGGFLSIAEFSKLGYDMNFGVDGYLIGKAREDNKAILELESQAGQLKMLNDMSPQLQEAFLENAISTLESGKAPERVTGMVNAWQSGDVNLMQAVAKAANKDARLAQQFDEVLLYSRHEAMLKKIEGYLAGNVPHFVAVGSLHLVGPRGLVEMLKARGFAVRQL